MPVAEARPELLASGRPERPLRPRRLVALGVAALAALAAVIAVLSITLAPHTHTLTATVADVYALDVDGTGLHASSAPTLKPGDEVVVEDNNGNVIGRSRLGTRQRSVRSMPYIRNLTTDTYAFTVEDLPETSFYNIHIGAADWLFTRSYDDLVAAHWRIALR